MKRISLIALVLITSTALFAQNENRTEMASSIRFGIKAGANLSKLRPSQMPSGTEVKTNLHTSIGGGFLVNIPFGASGMAIQPEVLFNGQGSKMNVTTSGLGGGNDKYEQDMRYISVPVMLQWKGASGFYAELGPQMSFLIDAKAEAGDVEEDNKDDFENFELAGAFGLGYMTRVGVGIGARYNHGFTNVLNNETSNEDARLRHSVIHIGLFYHFGANK